METLPDKLLKIFQNVNEWLRFAEAKNAALLALSGTGMTASITLLATVQVLPVSLKIALLTATFFLCTCSILCSISFLPKISLEIFMRRKSSLIQHLKIHQEDNLYYFGHLRKYEAKQLMDAVIQNYSIDLSHQLQEKESKDLADQIIVNSSIAFRKYQLFTYAIFCLIGSISTVPLCVILSFLLK